MEHSFLQTIILYCLKQLNGERTIYSIYHLLNGKKSSQTIQDAHLFHLTAFFQTDTNMTRDYLENTVFNFSNDHYIEKVSEQRYCITADGESHLSKLLAVTPIPTHLNGWKFQRTGEILWERLSLAVQVISYLQNNESKYIPVQRNPETLIWIKHFLKQNKLNRETLAKKLFSELVVCLENGSGVDPNIFVTRLSGYHSVGLTSIQAAKKLQMESSYYHYHFLNLIHYLAGEIEAHESKFPILSAFLDRSPKWNLTQSTEKTFSLLRKGYSITDIMAIRHLKKSTIEDHLVELALNVKEFSINPYVGIEKQTRIKNAAKTTKTKQLKQIRQLVEETDYFDIRLVLAKYGEEL